MRIDDRLHQMLDSDPIIIALKAAQQEAESKRNAAQTAYAEACVATREGIAKRKAIHELTLEIEREREALTEIQQRIAGLETRRAALS